MDQDRTSEALVQESDMDVLMLDKIVASKVAEAVERVHSDAPYYMMESVAHNFESPSDAVYWRDDHEGNEDTCGYVLLPEDYLRLLVFKMSDWERPVHEPLTVADPRYRRQHGRVKGLRGTAQRPVCAVAVIPAGRVLEFWSCKSRGATIERALYVSKPVVEDDESIMVG